MSAREFAAFVGVSHQTINKMLAGVYGAETGEYPQLTTLISIARALHLPPDTVLAPLLPPELAGASTDDLRLALLISRLSDADRRLVESFILGARMRSVQHPQKQEDEF